MRICFLVNSMRSGGAERTVSYLCNDFVNRGNCTVDLVQYWNQEPFYKIDSRVNQFYLNNGRFNNSIITRVKNAIIRNIKFRQYCKKNRPDVVFCMLYTTKKSTYLTPKNIPIIMSERNNPEKEANLAERKKLFNSAKGIVFQTERAKQYYRDNILKDKTKGVVINNAIGNPIAYEINALEYEKKDKISAVGRIASQKNYTLLINAFSEIHKLYPNYILEIFGADGNENDKIKQIVKDKNLQNNVIFRGQDKEALKKIVDSKCYVMSSNYEGMPNALMEAMAIGLPCVSTDCPNGPAELIRNGDNGLLVPINDVNALTKAIQKMIEDEEFAKKCAINARKILLTHNVDIISNRFYEYIKKIAIKE